ncbi:hypothetical protein BPS13_0203 [Bacillus phage BPS13]|uniref:Uncharacterized protein n=1 Tax=Bacillus phage BPS13 TaxID=1136731 RepID=J9PUA7_9CAUD|nr:hypothetical protein [Bacillus thuringiensis]YP_006907762.1 hypothetical protein BPS13_0203 [Bacillus phage BPS13]AEZ50382.1 hypothetical protein BPS13_0203 [Bacillus phage BPS13]OTZ47820.1 hypothetical protein BK762_19220 [Bacillus thuringiensis serovar toumanoffi]
MGLFKKEKQPIVHVDEDYVMVSNNIEGFDALIVVSLKDAKVTSMEVRDCTLGNLNELTKIAKNLVIDTLLHREGRYKN